MRALFATVLMTAFIWGLAVSSARAHTVGGYTEGEIDDVEVVNAANFAVRTEQGILRKDNKDATVSLIGILVVWKQVVEGTNYRMTLKVNLQGNERLAEVIVWKKLSGDYELSSWNNVKEIKKDDN